VSLLAVLIIIYTILGVELTLRWNSVLGVYSINSTAQLIAFVIGVVTLVFCLLRLAYEGRKTLGKGPIFRPIPITEQLPA
jgi:hypothetical protein